MRSRYLHDENAVKQQIESHVLRLEQVSQRFGVPPKCSLLSNEHSQIVQQALYGHLEILPTEVLQKMIECEGAVNSMIEKEWIPREKTRQLVLDRWKVETRTKSKLNQDLVKQAMLAFASVADIDVCEQTQVTQPSALTKENTRMPHFEAVGSHIESGMRTLDPERSYPTRVDDASSGDIGEAANVRDLTVIVEERPAAAGMKGDETMSMVATAEPVADQPTVPAVKTEGFGQGGLERIPLETLQPDLSLSPHIHESVSEIQPAVSVGVQPRSMKVVTVSPKRSPTKPETDAEREEKVQVSESQPAPREGSDTHASALVSKWENIKEIEEFTPGSPPKGALSPPPATDPSANSQSALRVTECEPETAPSMDRQSPSVAPQNAASDGEEDGGIEMFEIESVSDVADSDVEARSHSQDEVGKSIESGRTNASIDRQVAESLDHQSQLRSLRSSGCSASMVASSEMSFQASIPSLEESENSDLGAAKRVGEVRSKHARLLTFAMGCTENCFCGIGGGRSR